jgi:hypothetical protein
LSVPGASQSSARYDFYRFAGGDARRRQDPAAALAWYGKAERYAPATESRERIEEVRRLVRSGERPLSLP